MAQLLVVDDEKDVLEMMSLLLEDRGFQVVTERDGRAAIERLMTGFRPDAIVLDLMMPVMDGRSFLQRLGQLPEPVCSTPVMVLTATRRPALMEGVALLAKPFDMDELVAGLDALIVAGRGAARHTA